MMLFKLVILTIDEAGRILLERLVSMLPPEFKISLVVTRETRDYDIFGNPVVVTCEKFNLPYCQPDFNEEFYEQIKRLRPDLIIVSNFHKIIKKALFEIPTIGTFNIHSSYLPEMRGGTSIIWALKQGLTETGVTLHEITEGIDDGDIVSQKKVQISFWDTQRTLYEKITIAKFELLLDFLNKLAANSRIIKIPQNHEKATYLPKRKDSDGKLDLNDEMLVIYNHIRSFDPWTGAYIEIGEYKIRLRKVLPVKYYIDSSINDKRLIVSRKGSTSIQSLVIESVTDVVEQPASFEYELGKKVLQHWLNFKGISR